MTPTGNFIIGVHTGGNNRKMNYGTMFWDDKGLIDIFGFEVLKKFMDNIKEYEPKSYLWNLNFKY